MSQTQNCNPLLPNSHCGTDLGSGSGSVQVVVQLAVSDQLAYVGSRLQVRVSTVGQWGSYHAHIEEQAFLLPP